MFCPTCGKEIEDGTKFCPGCGAPLNSNNVTNPAASTKNEVFLRGIKCAGNSKYYAFTYFLPLAVVVLGAVLYESIPAIGLILILAAIVFAIIGRKIFRQSILFDDTQKMFIYNAHSHLNFTIKKIALSDIKSIRIRYVKVGIMDAKYSLNDPGKYNVISFDAVDNSKSLSVWFSKPGNLDEFIPVVENALQQNEKNISIDKKQDLIKLVEFTKESEQ